MKTKKLIMISLILATVMLVLGLSGNVKAVDVTEPNRKIASEFDESFVNAILATYDDITTEDEFTWEWASKQTKLELSNMSIGGIDKGGTNPHVLTTYFCNLKILKHKPKIDKTQQEQVKKRQKLRQEFGKSAK